MVKPMTQDHFDQYQEWATKPLDSHLTLPVEIHNAVMALPPDDRNDREKVNEAVREGLRLSELRDAGSADRFGVPYAEE